MPQTVHLEDPRRRCVFCPLFMKAPLSIKWVYLLLATLPFAAQAQLTPDNVLVVYNDPGSLQTSDGYQVFAHYQTKRPGVHQLNLDDATVPTGRVNYVEYETKIRDKIRTFLTNGSLETTIRVIVLTKGIPHQIPDINDGTVGNSASGSITLLKENNITFASVDSELCLLWHDLDDGEADGDLDSYADNFIVNPYYQSASNLPVSVDIDVSTNLSFTEKIVLDDGVEKFRHWEISAPEPAESYLYLTARLDGDTVDDAKALVDRAENILLDRASHAIILDETFSASDSNFDGADYSQTALALSTTWTHIIHDETSDFLAGELPSAIASYPSTHLKLTSGPIAFLSGFGANHPGGSHTNWISSYMNQLPNGAIYNTYESFNGQQFGSQTPASAEHGQVAKWVAIGGTFGLGHVWEPFTFAVAKNETLTENFYNNGLTWVEAAWSSIQVISWQNTVVGDPLAKLDSTAFINVPQRSISVTGPNYNTTVLEEDLSNHTITITLENPAAGNVDISLNFQGATIGTDFMTTLPGYSSGSSASVSIADGATQESFNVTILSDTQDEGLEILTISLAESSLDTNGDSIGEGYGFIHGGVVIPIADAPYDWWRFHHFGAYQPLEDSDEDGLENLWEYFIQSAPDTPMSSFTEPLTELKATNTEQLITFDLPKTVPSDSKLIVEASPILTAPTWPEIASRIGNGSWSIIEGYEISTDTTPNSYNTVTITTTTGSRAFRRFRVEVIPSP